MRTQFIRMKWSGAFLATALGVAALVPRSYAQYHKSGNRPAQPPSTNQTVKPKPPAPQEKPQKFKDLAINTEFYYLADKDHKTFPWIKISTTAAKSVVTPAKPTSTVTAIPAETMVIVKNDDAKKDAAGGGGEKSAHKPGTPSE